MTVEKSQTLNKAVAKAIADAAVAAAKVVAQTADETARKLATSQIANLEQRVGLLETNLTQIEKEVKRGNDVAEEILEVVKLTKVTGTIIKWVATTGAAVAAMATAWHWYK